MHDCFYLYVYNICIQAYVSIHDITLTILKKISVKCYGDLFAFVILFQSSQHFPMVLIVTRVLYVELLK